MSRSDRDRDSRRSDRDRGSSDRSGTRVYVGNLSSRTREQDLDDAFYRYGRILRIDLKNGFAFIEFEDGRDADDAVRDMDRYELDGRRLTCEHARGSRGSKSGPTRPRSSTGYRLEVENMDNSTSWQDLKDFARKAGNVVFTDVWMDRGKKFGVIEYSAKEDMEKALRELDDQRIEKDGKRVRLTVEKKKSSRSRSKSPGARGASKDRKKSRSRSRSPKKSASRSRSKGRDSSKDEKKRSRSRSKSRDRDDKPKENGRSRSPSPARPAAGEGEKQDAPAPVEQD